MRLLAVKGSLDFYSRTIVENQNTQRIYSRLPELAMGQAQWRNLGERLSTTLTLFSSQCVIFNGLRLLPKYELIYL